MEKKRKLRDAQYYITVAKDVIDKGVVRQEELSEIIRIVDDKLGINHAAKVFTIVEKFAEVFEKILDVVTVEREPGERGRGKRLNIPIYSFKKGINPENINSTAISYFEALGASRNASVVGGKTITKEDTLYRNAYVQEAKRLKSESDNGLTQIEAIAIAKKNVVKLKRSFIEEVWELLVMAVKNRHWTIESSELKSKFGMTFNKNKLLSWKDQLEKYNIRFFVVITDSKVDGRQWAVKFANDPAKIMDSISSLAKEYLGLELVNPIQRPKEISEKKIIKFGSNPESIDNIPPRIKYIIFIMAGLIMKNDGKYVSTYEISPYLRENHYNKITTNDEELLNIVKTFPEFFERVDSGDRKGIRLSGICEETWKKIQLKFSPKSEKWIIPWCVNSGLSIEKVQEYFPSSYVEHPEIDSQSKIVIVVADKSIRSKINLAELQGQMRSCDFPIGEPTLVDWLESERKANSVLFCNNFLLDRRKTGQWSIKTVVDRDKILYQIEEGYL